MTRINMGYYPRELPTKLLIAEHREITRIPNLVSRLVEKRGLDVFLTEHCLSAPDQEAGFRLGAGHMKWFYVLQDYLHDRYVELYHECRRRDFDVTWKIEAFNQVLRFDDLCRWYQDYDAEEMVSIIDDARDKVDRRLMEKGWSVVRKGKLLTIERRKPNGTNN